MPPNDVSPDFLWELFSDLRRRKFPLGISDYHDLRTALWLGFGWSSHEELVELCCTLWAKSTRDADTIRALFVEFAAPEWSLRELEASPQASKPTEPDAAPPATAPDQPPPASPSVAVEKTSGLPPISLTGVDLPSSHLTLVPRFPLTYREVAQIWRRIRQPARFGPRTEIDLDATFRRATRTGVFVEPVLIAPRRNTSRLLLLVDCLGSMAPFRSYVHEIVAAIMSANGFGRVGLFYFHDTPAEGATMPPGYTPQGLQPALDPILDTIAPLTGGRLYQDEQLTQPAALEAVYETYAAGADVAILSDGGAARGGYDYQRLLDTIAALKTLRAFTRRIVWLNPLPAPAWANSTAAAIARHTPMFPLDAASLQKAVAGLKAEHLPVEKGL